jgi:predicted RNase H-related nuclease YkuK (DUF458 family)
MIAQIRNFVADDPTRAYRIMIGTDSMPNPDGPVYLVTAIVIHRVGNGGIYFWQRRLAGPFPSLRNRMRAEADRSVRHARRLRANRAIRELFANGVNVHLDVGNDGATREVIAEVVGYVHQFGFPAEIKPTAIAASRVAHRHTALPALTFRPA